MMEGHHTNDGDTRSPSEEPWPSKQKVAIFVLVIVGLASLLMVIMIPRSFKKVEFNEVMTIVGCKLHVIRLRSETSATCWKYYSINSDPVQTEYAFKRRKASGRVNTDTVYSGGRYPIGITYEFKAFPADAHFVNLFGLHVFTSDRLEVTLDCSFQYFLRIEDLKLLHDTFDLRYKDIMEQNARDALKSAATQFSTRDYGTIRDVIEETIFQAIRARLGGSCCLTWCDLPEGECNTTSCIPRDSENCGPEQLGLFANVRYFQLLFVEIPKDVVARNLLTLTQTEDAEKEEYVQEYQVVQILTQKMVQDINNEASELSQNATAQSDLIRAKAVAEAQALIESAHSQGLAWMYEILNVTTEEEKASLNYLRTLRDHQNVHMSINFESLVNAANFRPAN